MYREWLDLAQETTALSKVREQLQAAAAEVNNFVFAGDINLNTDRKSNVRYGRRCLMLAHDRSVGDSDMRYLETGVTYQSHGQHLREDGEARGHESVLNHICVTKDLEATVSVLSDATTDHFPIVASVSVDKVAPTTKSIERRSFKALERPALL
jgi:endonuclease/exonuclease/phosphatase family metal-dependent hydrolase